MTIEPDLQDSLANIIAKEVPIADEYEGRTILVRGIGNQNGWRRHQENKRLDILNIIDYAVKYVAEDSENINSWGLIILINNTINEVRGTATVKKLQELKRKCELCWEKEHNKTSNSNIKPSEQVPIDPLPTEPACPTEPSHPQPLSLPQEDLAQKAPFEDFFNTTNCLLQTASTEIEAAQEPFANKSSNLSNPARRRHALRHLESVQPTLHQLRKILEETSPLPETITAQGHILLVLISSLIEQILSLTDWIDKNSGALQEITERFARILQTLTELNILKGG